MCPSDLMRESVAIQLRPCMIRSPPPPRPPLPLLPSHSACGRNATRSPYARCYRTALLLRPADTRRHARARDVLGLRFKGRLGSCPWTSVSRRGTVHRWAGRAMFIYLFFFFQSLFASRTPPRPPLFFHILTFFLRCGLTRTTLWPT